MDAYRTASSKEKIKQQYRADEIETSTDELADNR
jgi:hypothetical protein